MIIYLTSCRSCGSKTNKKYARAHQGQCKRCADPSAFTPKQSNEPTREQRIIDCGYQAYAREEGWYD